MALNFPGSPTPNQVYTDVTTKLSWVWNDVLGAWESAEQPPVIVADLQPDTTSTGKLWYRPATNVLKVYNGSEWTEAKSVFGVNYSATAPTLRPDGSSIQNGDQWYNFNENKLYIYDAGSWVDIAPNLGSPSFAAGTSALPGLPVTGDADTGIYSPGANQLGFSVGGNAATIINNNGVGINGSNLSGVRFGVYDTVNSNPIRQVLENKSTSGSVLFLLNRGVDGAQGQAAIRYNPGTEFSIGPESNDTLTPFIINVNNSTESLRIATDGTCTIGPSPATAKFSVSGSAPSSSLIVDSNGRVGVGGTPAFKLDVVSSTGINTVRSYSSNSSDARFVAKNTTNETIFGSDSTGSYINQASDFPIRFLVNNVERLRLLSDGSVSIRTDGASDARLHVAGTKNSNIIHLESNTGSYDGIYLQQQTLSGQNGGVRWIPNTTPVSGSAQFTTNFASVTSGGTVSHNVRVEGNLTVTGTITDSSGPYLTASNYTTYTVTKTGTGSTGTWPISITGSAATATTANSASSVAWAGVTGKPTTISGYGIIDAVPLNSPSFTGTPTAPTPSTGTNSTQIATTSYVVSRISNDAPTKSGGGATGTWSINISGSSASCIGNANTATTASLATDVVGTANRILFNSSTNNTSTSSNLIFDGQNLTVGGSLQSNSSSVVTDLSVGSDITAGGLITSNSSSVVTDLSVGSDITAGGNITAGGLITANSDISLKKNIQQIENALEKTLSLVGVEFDMISSGEHQIGLIAQNVEQILPEVVITSASGIKSVAYQNIVALLIESIKEQQKQIEELKTILNNIEY